MSSHTRSFLLRHNRSFCNVPYLRSGSGLRHHHRFTSSAYNTACELLIWTTSL